MANLTQCVKAGSEEKTEGYLIKFDYDKDLVEKLKAAIPHIYREWRPETSEWWVSNGFQPVLRQLFGNFDTLANQPRLF